MARSTSLVENGILLCYSYVSITLKYPFFKKKRGNDMATLKTLLENLDVTVVRGRLELDITDVVYDSRKITKGCLFICIEGANFDGHSAAAQAVEQGAAALVVQRPVKVPEDAQVAIVQVESTRYAMAFISAAWFGHPAEKMKTIGITGTKGIPALRWGLSVQ